MDLVSRRVVVVGAGFSGTMVAAHLLRGTPGVALEVVLINRSGPMARGQAYGTRSDTHLLNVPAGRMGAHADDEGGFLRFVRQASPAVDSGDFVPRRWYGDYLASELRDAEQRAPAGTRLTRLVGEVVRLEPRGGDQVDLTLRDQRVMSCDRVVLALGNYTPADPPLADRRVWECRNYIRDPWAPGALSRVPPTPTLLVGTGLTMADVALTIGKRPSKAPIFVLSRRGLLPLAHRSPSHPPAHHYHPPDLLTGPSTARAYLRSVRRHVRRLAADGLDWRDVVGGLRDVTPQLWDQLSLIERQRFLRHVRPYWEVHRHRCAPQIAEALDDLKRRGILFLLAGRLVAGTATANDLQFTVRLRGSNQTRTLSVGAVVNCTGPESDLGRVDEPLIRGLLENGMLRRDPLGLGIHTDDDYRVTRVDDTVSPTLFYVGPLLKSRFWESTAVPELRVHAAGAVTAVLRSLAPSP